MLLTQPNLHPHIHTYSTHRLSFAGMCPVSRNPQEGSTLIISYRPHALFLEVDSLYAYVMSYRGGKGDIRDMEGMIQQIAQDCANTIGVKVRARAYIILQRGAMEVLSIASPERIAP